nr:MAG: hypothetical protein JST_0410 [Candidatus Parcubacteria bacterium]
MKTILLLNISFNHMKKKNNFFKLCCENLIIDRYLFLSIILSFVIAALIPSLFLSAAPLNTPGGGYRVEARTLSGPIFYYNGGVLNPIGCCVNNVSYQDYFVPTNSKAEWNSFYNSATAGALRNNLTPVGCVGDGVCNLATENCLSAPTDCGTCGAQCVNNGVCSTIEREQYANDNLLFGWRPTDWDSSTSLVCPDCCLGSAGVGTCGQCGGSESLGDGCCTYLEWDELVMSEEPPAQDRIDDLYYDCYNTTYTPPPASDGGDTGGGGGGGGGAGVSYCSELYVDGSPFEFCFQYT